MKKKGIIIGIIAAVCVLVAAGILVYRHIIVYRTADSVAIIGGADGPTSIFIAGKVGDSADGVSTLPLGIYMQVTDYQEGLLTVNIINQSGYEMTYGDEFFLQKQEDNGEWTTLEPDTETAAGDTVHTIKDLTTDTVQYDLTCYGTLSAGHYKFLKMDLEAEFDIP